MVKDVYDKTMVIIPIEAIIGLKKVFRYGSKYANYWYLFCSCLDFKMHQIKISMLRIIENIFIIGIIIVL